MICALKGSSVVLPCTAKHLTSRIKWYTLHWKSREYILKNLTEEGNFTRYLSEEGNFTLTINDLRESDDNFYCCEDENEISGRCWFYRKELQVTDLQVKVIPTTEGHTLTLMCSTSCPLTENPAAYIWYKNREFLYEDWSPWYQELVSSEEGTTYSCAIKGYEDLRAPEVSVDSVTSTCFNVTYAKGRMCSHKNASVEEPCSITYPREVFIQKTLVDNIHTRMTCTPLCPLMHPQTAYSWYDNKHLYRRTESQHFTVLSRYAKSLSCAVKGHTALLSPEVCTTRKDCLTVNYHSRRLCALEGSSVNISSEYSYFHNLHPNQTFWCKIRRDGQVEATEQMEAAGRVDLIHDMNGRHILKINNLRKNDSAEYSFRLWSHAKDCTTYDSPKVILIVTGLNVTFTPSAMVTEGQTVTLTCSTSCPVTDNTNYIWYLNRRPVTLPQSQNKHLVLDPVSSQHAGNYSCAVKTHKNIISHERILTVYGRTMLIINIIRLAVVLLIPGPLLLFHLWMRKK
ncbi:uncharacterized protein LOC113128610 [Mastacembelus armatus]|uniref:uncharacterized protein LOC113128610 n=1 Tax=Mastacembelus armatus TaxID=205130 RepID=UPI000E4599C5|nr:uncharacterized protein LOC113128610 [Mastacembelus armatus]